MLKISACVIVKNEAKNIGRWAENMRAVADELVVVDTGSTDNTAEIAETHGARVYNFAWRDDFSAAKNYALDKAEGDWIIFLDADEYFATESLAKIRPMLENIQPHFDIAGIACRLVNIDADDGNRFCSSFVQIRIFRHNHKYRYVGNIHEKISLPPNKRTEFSEELVVYHTGYSRSIVKDKLRRNLSLLNRRIESQGGQPTLLDEQYLMDIYYGLDERERAAQAAQKLIERTEAGSDIHARAYETLVSVYVDGDYPETEVTAVLENAGAAYPQRADFALMRGLYLYRLRDFLSAEKYLNLGLDLWRRRNEGRSPTQENDNGQRLVPAAYCSLGELAVKKFKPEVALEHFVTGLKIFPYNRNLLTNLYKLLEEQNLNPGDIVQTINGLYDKKRDAGFIAATLAAGHCGEVYWYYAKRAGISVDLTEKYLTMGRGDAAAEIAAENLSRWSRLGIWAERNGWSEANSVLNVALSDEYQKFRASEKTSADTNDWLQGYERMCREIDELRGSLC